jgi:hypothetical protein
MSARDVPCQDDKGGVALGLPHFGAVWAFLAALTVPRPC